MMSILTSLTSHGRFRARWAEALPPISGVFPSHRRQVNAMALINPLHLLAYGHGLYFSIKFSLVPRHRWRHVTL
jgi:hypothetical protein